MTRLFKMIAEIFKERRELVRQTIEHRKAMREVSEAFGYSFPLHDLDKVLMYPVLGRRLTDAIHCRFSGHHVRNGDVRNKVEAIMDWESSMLTGKGGPMDAYDTWMKLYPEVDMAPTFRKLGMIPPLNN